VQGTGKAVNGCWGPLHLQLHPFEAETLWDAEHAQPSGLCICLLQRASPIEHAAAVAAPAAVCLEFQCMHGLKGSESTLDHQWILSPFCHQAYILACYSTLLILSMLQQWLHLQQSAWDVNVYQGSGGSRQADSIITSFAICCCQARSIILSVPLMDSACTMGSMWHLQNERGKLLGVTLRRASHLLRCSLAYCRRGSPCVTRNVLGLFQIFRW